MKKPLPIGVENFDQLINEGYYYIDKTLLIKEILDRKGAVNLFLRPRRFGKTMSMSMLKSFFEKPIDGKKNDVFKNLKIWNQGEKYTKEYAKYPVVNFSFKTAEAISFKEMYEQFKVLIAKEYIRHSYLLNSDALSDAEKIEYKFIMNKQADEVNLKNSIYTLTNYLEKYYGEKVIVIIDEYDAPIQRAYLRGFYKEAIDFVRPLLSEGLKTNFSVKFTAMTGCVRVAKEGLLSGFNNPKINSILDAEYSDSFGFTQDEIDELLVAYNFEEKRENIKKWYNGYMFGKSQIYNPWSIINYIYGLNSDENLDPKPYWANTSGNDLVRKLIFESDKSGKSKIEKLISGESIELKIDENIVYEDLLKDLEKNIFNILFWTGYLTQTSKKIKNDEAIYQVKIPNQEVCTIYMNIVKGWFDEQIETADLKGLFEKMFAGDAEGLECDLNAILSESISFWDSQEQYYHGFMLGLVQQLQAYRILSNRESGDGRFDLALVPETSKSKPAVIMEFKVVKKDEFMYTEDRCLEALKQIEDKKYFQELKSWGYKNIVKYGIAFIGKNCRIMVEKS